MKIAYHPFDTARTQGGALYYYSEVARILSALKAVQAEVIPHSFFDLLGADERAQGAFVGSLGAEDVLVSNVGPYAQFYHYLRERYEGRFRIVRDVQTSSWAGYLLQEALSGPMTRPRDRIVFPSEFSRSYFLSLFPRHLAPHNTVVAYPLASSFPSGLERRARTGARLGYLGRLADDKNIAQLLDIFVLYARAEPSASLHLAGPLDRHCAHPTMAAVRRYLRRRGVAASRVRYYGNLPYARIWQFYRDIDVFLFPALSSVESLGRVLLEAQYAGVPTVAADYAAASEILPSPNLIAPNFHVQRRFSTLETFSFGTVSVSDALRAIAVATVGDPSGTATRYRNDTYLRAVLQSHATEPAGLSSAARAFIAALRYEDLHVAGDATAATCAHLLAFHRRYNDNRLPQRVALCAAALSAGNPYSIRYALYLNRLFLPNSRVELSHAREHCWIAGYRPSLQLDAQTIARNGSSARLCSSAATLAGAIG